MNHFDVMRKIINPILRHLLKLELTKILAHDGKWIGVGVRVWQE